MNMTSEYSCFDSSEPSELSNTNAITPSSTPSGSCFDHDNFSLSHSLDYYELEELWQRPLELFRKARELCTDSCGDDVSYVINRNINFTDICVGTCKFCAFRNHGSYILSDDEILTRLADAEELGATEVCFQGGLVPDMTVEDYARLIELMHSHHPKIHIHAYSPMEVFHMARNSRMEVPEVLKTLKSAGLGSMPGTAAEILVDDVRSVICPSKLKTNEWRNVVTSAHRLGIPTTSTMLYGHIESFRDRLRHLEVLRGIQAQTKGITEFVLLPFMGGNNELGRNPDIKPLDLLDHLKMHALARVALYPLITNIQCSWVKLGRINAGAALEWGANDLGGTLMEENISRSAGSKESQYMSAAELEGIIEAHGKNPVERNTLYQRVYRDWNGYKSAISTAMPPVHPSHRF